MAEKQTVTRNVATLQHYDVEYECPLSKFLAKIEAIVAQIPVDQRENAYVDWMDGSEYDSGYIDFEYRREETDEEAAAREQEEARQREAELRVQEYNERVTYERLKAKYEK